MTTSAAYTCPRCAESGATLVLGAPKDRLDDRIAEHDHWHHGQHPDEQRRTITINEPITFEVCSGCERMVGDFIGVASIPSGFTVTLRGDGTGQALPDAGYGRTLEPDGAMGPTPDPTITHLPHCCSSKGCHNICSHACGTEYETRPGGERAMEQRQ